MALNTEQLFQAVDIIVTQRLKDVSYDTSLICEIIDDINKDNNLYTVTDGNVKFDAYSDNLNYRIGDQVRVTVLNGDFSGKKYIEGKYLADTQESAVKYVPPLDTVLITDKDEINITDFQLMANGYVKQVELGIVKFSEENKALQKKGIYNTLAVSSNFETDLGILSAGRYGLRLDLLCETEGGGNSRALKIITFDSAEMFGNPYSFEIPSYQQKKISLIDTGIISEIVISAYQGFYLSDDGVEIPAAFVDEDGELIPESPIGISNLQIALGADLVSVANRSFQIYTTSSSTYKYEEPSISTNDKTIGSVWYNKTDANEYIGFSNGLADDNYDEITYRKEAWADSRLIAEKGQFGVATDETSLTLSADIRESESIMREAANILVSDLAQVIFYLTDKLSVELSSYFTNLVAAEGVYNTSYADAIAAIDELQKMYKNVLWYGYEKQSGFEPVWDDSWVAQDWFNIYNNAINIAVQETANALEQLRINTEFGEPQDAYRKVYEAYRERVERELTRIESLLSQVSIGLEDYEQTIKSYSTKTNFLPYGEKDLSAYDNKYCIYWYLYNSEYLPTGDEATFGNFVEEGWERLSEFDNVGRPMEVESSVNGYLPKESSTSEFNYYMSPTSKEQQIKAVLFYNHQMVESNVLTFKNLDEIPEDVLVDETDGLIISNGSNSFDHYQSYNQSNILLNNIDKSIERKLKCSYEGRYLGNENLIGAEIYWYIPVVSTMLTFDKDYLIAQGFITDANGEVTSQSRAGYVYFKKVIGSEEVEQVVLDPGGYPMLNEDGSEKTIIVTTSREADRYFSYKIKDYYEQGAHNNTIDACVYLAESGSRLTGEKTFTFSTFGTNGTKYTLTMSPKGRQIATVSRIDGESLVIDPLELSLILRNAAGEKVSITNSLLSSGSFTDEQKGYNLKIEWLTPEIDTYVMEQELIDGVVELEVAADESEDVRDCVAGILKASVAFNLPAVEDAERVVDLTTLYSIPYAKDVDYYIQGPMSIIYDSSGTVSHMSGDAFRLYQKVIDGIDVADIAPDDQIWSLEHYDKSGVNLKDYTDLVARDTILTYLPKLDEANTLVAPNIYLSYSNDEAYYTFAVCRNSSGEVLWSHPIIISQNKYDSTVLNDWDGSFYINEENGTVLSTMVGAGRKTVNNTFEGILMGEVGRGANFNDNNYDGIGLYGFNDGAQSFAFGIDGTGFIGKAGRGRIEFDGNNSRIYNSSYQTDGRGMLIDLDDGLIDMTGQSGTGVNVHLDTISPYFYIDSATDKRLMNIADDEYYLQSENYQPGSFNASDVTLNTVGAGTHFDLQTGLLDAYDLKILTKNVLIDSSATADPFFVVKDNDGCNLFYAGIDNYYLKSHGYSDTDLSGMKIDLTSGLINAYNFSLTGNAEPGNYAGSYLKITSTPSLILHLKDSTNKQNLDLLKIDTSNFVMNSANWGNNNGMQIDVGKGFIKMYREGSSDNAILIDSTAAASDGYPFQVGKVDKDGNRAFRVKWDGTIEGGSTYPWKITSGGDATFDQLTANGGKIGGITINKSSLSGKGWSLSYDGANFTSINVGNNTLTSSDQGVVVNGLTVKERNLICGSTKITQTEIELPSPTLIKFNTSSSSWTLTSYIEYKINNATSSMKNSIMGGADSTSGGKYIVVQSSSGGAYYRYTNFSLNQMLNAMGLVS